MDRIDAMRAFVTVVNEGSFTHAADRLGMSPQLASKYVSQLAKANGGSNSSSSKQAPNGHQRPGTSAAFIDS